MSSDDSSILSDVPSDVEEDLQLKKKDGILKFFSKAPKPGAAPKKAESPLRPKREPSPPHEYALADNPDIAFIVMFRSRFTEAFPKSLLNFGPQELEQDLVEPIPGEGVERFLCALLGLLLNRKQDVKPGHYNRALEDAVSTNKAQWPRSWEEKSPLSGGANFVSMSPTERLSLLRYLICWALSTSDAVKAILATSYKSTRHEDDLNQPLSVQPWGSDSDKRRYYLIEGLDDTHFRVYRESNHMALKRTWWSVAGDIEELQGLAQKLSTEDGGQKARTLSGKITAAIPRFEATEDKRKRREYRQNRKQIFKRQDFGTSLYEGRTRGKRVKYNYSDDDMEGVYSDATNARRSSRNTRNHSPVEPTGPTVTLSGRQVKTRQGGMYGESMLSGAQNSTAASVHGTSEEPDGENGSGRPRRAAAVNASTNGYAKPKGGRHIEGYNELDEMSSDEDDASEQDYGDDEEEEHVSLQSENEPDATDDDEEMEDAEPKKLIIKLAVKTPTPERKTTIKLRMSPEKDSTKLNRLFADASVPSQINGKTGSTNSKENIQPRSVLPDQPAKSPRPVKSPLAFRGSPEKAAPYVPIDVGN